MTEEGFRLTPIDIRALEFRHKMRGYDPASVEAFRGQVADELERLLRERAALEERVKNFRDQLKAFREREAAMNEALVAAQQLRADAAQAVKRDAEGIIQQARAEGERILSEARTTERAVRREIEAGQRQFNAYLTSFRMLLERHMGEVDALEAHEREGVFVEGR
jgi:DivIVA domain-containing protein